MKKLNHIESAMRYHSLVYVIVACLVGFGIFSLPRMNKDEFPQVTIRQGLIVAVYPGATAQEVEEQVAKPIEQYLFTFREIDKKKTYSLSQDGIVYVFAALAGDVTNANEAWSKIRGGVSLLKQMQLPTGLLAVAIIDDFGNTSSMLLAIESNERTPRELEEYTELISDRLREIPEIGSIKILGQQNEEIAVTLDVERMTKYAVNQNVILARLATQGFRTMTGEIANDMGAALVHVDVPYSTEYELGEQIIYADPLTGQSIRLRDIATIERRYKDPKKLVEHFADGTQGNCLVLNLEMQPGNNIVAFGKEVDEILDQCKASFPPDIRMHKITDQPRVVDASVRSFLKDLVVSVIIVVLVMLILFPMRTALVSSTGLPICIAITLGIMYIFGIELNTVTLAALIVVLGMVVDDSVIVIDGYSDLLEKGHSRWYAAAQSTSELFVPMIIATTSISGMFFPMLGTMTGPMADFVKLFPWAVFIALSCSIFYAAWVIPYMSTVLIRREVNHKETRIERIQRIFFEKLQGGYQWLLDLCFRHPWGTIFVALIMVGLGVVFFFLNDIALMPKAERDAFAVEIHLTEGSSLEQTQAIVDSLGAVFSSDPMVESVTAFVGMASPRFHATYAPQIGGENYAQFIVNTKGDKQTVALVEKYQPIYENAFPNAFCRFKRMDYQALPNPIEIYVQGSDIGELEQVADSLKAYLSEFPELTWVHSNYDETVQTIKVRLREDEADRLGVTQSTLSLYLAGVLQGRDMTSIWENGYKTPVTLYTMGADTLDYADMAEILIPTVLPGVWVPLRQVAYIEPDFHHAQIQRRNSVRTITVAADLRGTVAATRILKPIKKHIKNDVIPNLPDGVMVKFGGVQLFNEEMMPGLIMTVGAALLVLLVLLVYHFKNISISLLSLSVSALCLFGACFGLWMFGLNFSITAVLGIVSLIGIIVRNAIIMYEYAEHLRTEQNMTSKEAAYQAGLRRMRPIFLTTATTALGVVPMITAATQLWMPMGVVICFGAVLTMPMVVTILPVAYWKLYENKSK